MKLVELIEKLLDLSSRGWANDEVRVVSNNGNRLNESVVGVTTINPPVPRPLPEVHILVDD